jgi:hypothetical protein
MNKANPSVSTRPPKKSSFRDSISFSLSSLGINPRKFSNTETSKSTLTYQDISPMVLSDMSRKEQIVYYENLPKITSTFIFQVYNI